MAIAADVPIIPGVDHAVQSDWKKCSEDRETMVGYPDYAERLPTVVADAVCVSFIEPAELAKEYATRREMNPRKHFGDDHDFR